MILPNSILSAFTEKGTLLKWLKKVEAALKADVLTDISLNQISETQVTIKLTFADGSAVESPVLNMPRGLPGKDGANGVDGASASVSVGTTETGAAGTKAAVTNSGTPQNAVLNFVIPRGRDGKDGKDGQGVAATITIGETTTAAPGTPANVTNEGTEQDAVLEFVIPRGEKGEQGAPGTNGKDGVGFDSATKVEENAVIDYISETGDGMTVNGSFMITANGEVYEIPSVFKLPLKGSPTVVVDVDETEKYFTVHLDAAIITKLSKALVTPAQPPAALTIVAIGTNGAQTAVTIGDGLEVVNGVLQVKPASTGETWVLNEALDYVPGGLERFDVTFACNGNRYVVIIQEPYDPETGEFEYLAYQNSNGVKTTVYANDWISSTYRTITLDEPATGALLEWLQANGTKQG